MKADLILFTHSDGELPITDLHIFCLLVQPVAIVQPSDLFTLPYVGLAVEEDTIPRRSNSEEACERLTLSFKTHLDSGRLLKTIPIFRLIEIL